MYSSYSQRVSSLIIKNVPCTIDEVVTDPNGKFVMLVISLWNQKYVIVNVYLPTPSQMNPLYLLLEMLSDHSPLKLML